MKHLVRGRYQQFPYHLVEPSIWPIMVVLNLLSLALSLGLTMHGYMATTLYVWVALLGVIGSITLWIRDIIAEGTYLGAHTLGVRKGIHLGFWLFVVSEILIFASLFWAYFHSAMNPSIELGSVWPPVGIEVVQATELPLFNTVLLLSSGATVTLSHHGLINRDRRSTNWGLWMTTVLIVAFVICQYMEYLNAMFTISDGIYGSIFYAGTGLHFIHMVMLAVMLVVNVWRINTNQMTSTHHLGYETLILYLHVLDIIWLFLYIVFYWWGV